VSNHTYEIRNLRRKAIESFKGLSGSGLWKFINNTPILVGIAIAEDQSEERTVYFHGPQSVLSIITKLGQTYDSS
jgi:hypothetical protein